MRRRKVYDKVLGPVVEKGKRLPEIKNLEGLYPETDLNVWLAQSMEKFKEEISKAKTIILAGVPGKYEDEGHRQGTKEVFEAIANSSAFKVAGGGDAPEPAAGNGTLQAR